MARLLSTLLVVGLLAGTSAAFAITEGLKLQPSPVTGTAIARKVFSPTCACPSDQAAFSFKLRKPGPVTVAMVDSNQHVVRTVLRRTTAHGRVYVTWNGHTESGAIAPEGSYKPQVRLPDHRTIELPNPIRIDLTPPQIKALKVAPRSRVLIPGHRGALLVRYRVDEPAHAELWVDGVRAVGPTLFAQQDGQLRWFARTRGADATRGVHRLELGAVDIAGNVGKRVSIGTLRVTYIRFARPLVRVRAGGRIVLGYSPPDAARWQLNSRSGIARHGRLAIKAPALPGRYSLYILQYTHADRATVVVRP